MNKYNANANNSMDAVNISINMPNSSQNHCLPPICLLLTSLTCSPSYHGQALFFERDRKPVAKTTLNIFLLHSLFFAGKYNYCFVFMYIYSLMLLTWRLFFVFPLTLSTRTFNCFHVNKSHSSFGQFVCTNQNELLCSHTLCVQHVCAAF